jgi:GNAT superfamily N-acetyltransferase
VNVKFRTAAADDAEQLVPLIEMLGHSIDAAGVCERLAYLDDTDIPQIVAVDDGRVLGLCGLHVMTAIHRPHKVGRITILAVLEDCRGRGIGRSLIEAAEMRLRQRGCQLLEVTSNDRLVSAHGFYLHLGYEQTSKRFAKALA